MTDLSLLPAVANKIKATSDIIAELPQGTSGVIPASSLVGTTFPTDLKLPCIVVQGGGIYGLARDLPHMQEIVLVRVYDLSPAPNHAYYGNINRLIWKCIATLDRQPLVMESSYYNLFELQFDNYISREDFDQAYKLPFRLARFRAFTVTNLRNQSPT